MGASIDKEGKKLLAESITKNKTIEKLGFRSNDLQLPGILGTTKKAVKSLRRLTHLDLSFNGLQVAGAKALAKFLANYSCNITHLVLTNNHLTTKGANILLPAVKDNTTLLHLDMSSNWLKTMTSLRP